VSLDDLLNTPAETADDVIIKAIATELQVLDLEGPYALQLDAQTAFHLIAVLQLALRHPDLPDGHTRGQVQEFVDGLAQIFTGMPACSRVIEQGNDPAQDRPRPREREGTVNVDGLIVITDKP
jgi:hypothetical protein